MRVNDTAKVGDTLALVFRAPAGLRIVRAGEPTGIDASVTETVMLCVILGLKLL